MNRRSFLLAASGFLALHEVVRGTPAPVATPTDFGPRPDPIDLGSGITLLDYRMHPGLWPAMIGEIRNEADAMVDSPTVSVTYSKADGSWGFAWLSPIQSVIDSGERVALFGPLPDPKSHSELLGNEEFALCTEAQAGPFTAAEKEYNIELIPIELDIEADKFRYHGAVANHGPSDINTVTLSCIVRDIDGRISGFTPYQTMQRLRTGTSQGFTVSMSKDASSETVGHPFGFISGDEYGVEVTASVPRSPIQQGCDFGRPWE